MSTPAPEESPFKGKSGIKRVWHALGYSIEGLAAAWRHEDAFRQLTLLALLLIPLALWWPDITRVSRAILVASSLATLVIELFNSAIEAA